MKKSIQHRILGIAIAVVVACSPALAKGPHGQGGGGKQHAEKHEDKIKNKDKDKHKDHDRDDHKTGPNSRPAGWDQGKKTGWGNCTVPPGQAKTHECRNGKLVRKAAKHNAKNEEKKPVTGSTTVTRTPPINRQSRTTTTTSVTRTRETEREARLKKR